MRELVWAVFIVANALLTVILAVMLYWGVLDFIGGEVTALVPSTLGVVTVLSLANTITAYRYAMNS